MIRQTRFQDTRVSEAAAYQYRVAAIDRYGNLSEKSEPVEIKSK